MDRRAGDRLSTSRRAQRGMPRLTSPTNSARSGRGLSDAWRRAGCGSEKTCAATNIEPRLQHGVSGEQPDHENYAPPYGVLQPRRERDAAKEPEQRERRSQIDWGREIPRAPDRHQRSVGAPDPEQDTPKATIAQSGASPVPSPDHRDARGPSSHVRCMTRRARRSLQPVKARPRRPGDLARDNCRLSGC